MFHVFVTEQLACNLHCLSSQKIQEKYQDLLLEQTKFYNTCNIYLPVPLFQILCASHG